MTGTNVSYPLILFDGVCNLCNSSVQFVIRHDPHAVFHFAALQSEAGQRELKKWSHTPGDTDSIVLIDDGVFQKSTAALKIARRLSGAWPALSVFLIIPRVIRDWAYDRVARTRYSVFGRADSCRVPSAELRERFLG